MKVSDQRSSRFPFGNRNQMKKRELKQMLDGWKKIFGNWKYLALTLFIAVLFYSLNVFISNWKSLIEFYPSFGFFGILKFFFTLALGFKNLIKFHSFISLIMISILFGMLFSLITYKSKLGIKPGKKVGILGGIGVFLGALIPGCTACGVGLVSVLGLGAGFLAFLPYNGLELSILAILILGFSITKITKEMHTCNIDVRR